LPLVRHFIQQELERIREERGVQRFDDGHFAEATRIFDELVSSEKLEEFLTLKSYEVLDGELKPNGVSKAPLLTTALPERQKSHPLRPLRTLPEHELVSRCE
jgi:hypothetical protein